MSAKKKAPGTLDTEEQIESLRADLLEYSNGGMRVDLIGVLAGVVELIEQAEYRLSSVEQAVSSVARSR